MFRSKKKKDIEVIKEQWKKVEDAWKSIEVMDRIYNSIKDFVFIILYFVSWFVPGVFLLLMTLLILDITVIESIEDYYIEKNKSR